MLSPSLPATSGYPRPLASLGEARVLFAMADEELSLFFPRGFDARLPRAARKGVRGIASDSWNALLTEHRPRVLVTNWSTPTLRPEQTTLAGGSIDYVCHAAGSVRPVVSREMLAAGLKVTNWGGMIAPQVAEHALLLILASLRAMPEWRDHARTPVVGRRREDLATKTLFGKRVSIHGFGEIARALIRCLQPFEVEVTAFSAGVSDDFIEKHGAQPASSLLELAREADVFVSCEALTSANRGSIDALILAALPEGAVFVNVGRGALVDEAALLDACTRRGLRAASDVFVDDPLPPDSPFLDLPGVIVSPHIAGPARDGFARCGDYALENVARYLAGREPLGLITPEVFDRST